MSTIDPATFAGADMEDARHGLRLVLWHKGADGERCAREVRGHEANAALAELQALYRAAQQRVNGEEVRNG